MLPQNQKQANIISRKSSNNDDALLIVMAICKLSMGKGDDPFVHIVTSLICVLILNSLIFNDSVFTPLSADPTFDLGDKITSYQMIGPILVHRRKLFSIYYFASSLMSLKSSISHLQAFGTNGEENLFNRLYAKCTRVCSRTAKLILGRA